jgi:hypothetical protein
MRNRADSLEVPRMRERRILLAKTSCRKMISWNDAGFLLKGVLPLQLRGYRLGYLVLIVLQIRVPVIPSVELCVP